MLPKVGGRNWAALEPQTSTVPNYINSGPLWGGGTYITALWDDGDF